MNRLIFRSEERCGSSVTLTGDRARHAFEVLRLKAGDLFRVGELNSLRAEAQVVVCEMDRLQFNLQTEYPPLLPSPLKVVLALPRPKALGRILESLTELGVKEIVLLHANKVEKSYWNAHQLKASEIEKHLWMGLQQAGDTLLPTVTMASLFRPFVEDRLSSWSGENSFKWVMHPSERGGLDSLPPMIDRPTVVAIGPEGGWTDFEVELFTQQGFRVASLDPRILSSETVIPVIAGRCLRGENPNGSQP